MNTQQLIIPPDDPETIRRGRIWLMWSAVAMGAFVFVTTLIGLGHTERTARANRPAAHNQYMAAVTADLVRHMPATIGR